MANFILTHAPLLQSSAQLLILPVSSDGTILDPVVKRCKTLYPNNYMTYRRYCIEGLLPTGTNLVTRRQREAAGLTSSTNRTQPSYIVNFAALDHPYHALRRRWLTNALDDLYLRLYELIRYEGVRRIALLARPLISKSYPDPDTPLEESVAIDALPVAPNPPILDWHLDIYPLIVQKMQDLPKVTVDIHVPHDIAI